MSWIDWSIAAVVLFSALQGVRRGVIAATGSAVGVVVAFLAASYWYRQLAGVVPTSLRVSEAWAATISFAALVAVVYAAIGFVATVLTGRPSAPARLLGAGAGALKGALLTMVLLTIAVASPAGEPVQKDIERSRIAPYAVQAQRAGTALLARVLPAALRPFGVDGARF